MYCFFPQLSVPLQTTVLYYTTSVSRPRDKMSPVTWNVSNPGEFGLPVQPLPSRTSTRPPLLLCVDGVECTVDSRLLPVLHRFVGGTEWSAVRSGRRVLNVSVLRSE